jgi:hypothetical protein
MLITAPVNRNLQMEIVSMDSRPTATPGIGTRIQWYLLKLPLTLVLIVAGFILEAMICWPFAMLCWLHTRRRVR